MNGVYVIQFLINDCIMKKNNINALAHAYNKSHMHFTGPKVQLVASPTAGPGVARLIRAQFPIFLKNEHIQIQIT